MKTLVALLILLLIPVLSWAATCTISGIVFNPDGTPLANGQVQFNSVVTQVLGGGASVPVQFISTTTDAHGNLKPFAVVQGLQGQFVFCNPMAGGCSAPTPALIPISATADISSILAGIQLASGGNVSANSLNVTGATTLGGTLVVTGQSTFNGPTIFNSGFNLTGSGNNACFADLGCWGATGIVNATHVSIGPAVAPALSAVRLQVVNTAIVSSLGTADSLGTNINMNYASGVHMNTTGQWIADVSYPMWFNQVSQASNGAEHAFMVYGPQTIGQPIDLSHRVQYMAVRTNTPGATAGLFLESGEIYVYNGAIIENGGTLGNGITASYAQNGGTLISVTNGDSTDGSAAAAVRASNGAYVTDLAVVGQAANLGGFFTANRSYISGNAPNGLLIEATGTNGNASGLYLSAPNANRVAVIGNQHFSTENDGVSLPVAQGNCGGGSAVQNYSTDNAGYVYVAGPTTACQVNFAAGEGIAGHTPSCMCNGYTAGTTVICNAVAITTGVTFNFNVSISGVYIPWICMF